MGLMKTLVIRFKRECVLGLFFSG